MARWADFHERQEICKYLVQEDEYSRSLSVGSPVPGLECILGGQVTISLPACRLEDPGSILTVLNDDDHCY